jgi:hypothetical protein
MDNESIQKVLDDTSSDSYSKVKKINLLIENGHKLTEQQLIDIPLTVGPAALNINSQDITIKHALRKLMLIPSTYSMFAQLVPLVEFIHSSSEQIIFDDYDMYFKPHHIQYCLEMPFDDSYTNDEKYYLANVIFNILGRYPEAKKIRDFKPKRWYVENTLFRIIKNE